MFFSSVCIACVVRLPLLTKLQVTDASCQYSREIISEISTYSFIIDTIVPTGMWAIVECNIGIGNNPLINSRPLQLLRNINNLLASVCLPIMRPLFTKHVSHPVRSRFSTFSWAKSSVRGSQRLPDEEGDLENSSTQNLSGKTLTTFPLPPDAYKYNNIKSPDGTDKTSKTIELELDVINQPPPVISSQNGLITPEDLTIERRRKEHWEIIEEREQKEIWERQRKERMDPARWEHRKKEWERIERINSKLRKSNDGKSENPPVRPSPSSESSWYNGWGNRLGSGDGNQGWELELGPMAGGVEIPPTARLERHAQPRTEGGIEAFGRF